MIAANLPVLIPILLLLASLLVPVCGIYRRALSYPIVLCTVFLAALLSVFGVSSVLTRGSLHYHLAGWPPPVGIEYVLDPLASFVLVVIFAISLLVLVHARPSLRDEIPTKEVPYLTVVMLLLAGFSGIVLTGDVFNLYVFLEISSLSSYALLAVGDKKSPVAAFRYLILGTIGASFYLLGVGLLYAMTGSLNMAELRVLIPQLADQRVVVAALVLIVSGIGIKMALFPLFGWLPDAYTSAPSTSTALIGSLGTKVAAYVMIRMLFYVFAPAVARDTLGLTDIIAWLSAAGILFGSVMAIAQTDLKRMLAYSSVSQIGYIGIGIGLANPLGFIGAILHILNHAVMKACLFLVTANLKKQAGHHRIDVLDGALRKSMPATMFAFSLAALSMVGIPPTAGFFSKWYLVRASFQESNWFFAFIILASSLLSAVYFFRVIERVYTDAFEHSPATDSAKPVTEAPWPMVGPTVGLAVGTLVLGMLNAFIVSGIIELMIPATL